MQITQEVTMGRTDTKGRSDSEMESVMVSPALRRGVGKHLIAECWDCNDRLFSATAVREALEEAVRASGATLLRLIVHTFEPYGVSAVAIVSESHLFLHTWPEMGYIAVDIFTCGDTFPERALEVIRAYFEPRRLKVLELERGVWP